MVKERFVWIWKETQDFAQGCEYMEQLINTGFLRWT
jgi:hypothetical protein